MVTLALLGPLAKLKEFGVASLHTPTLLFSSLLPDPGDGQDLVGSGSVAGGAPGMAVVSLPLPVGREGMGPEPRRPLRPLSHPWV